MIINPKKIIEMGIIENLEGGKFQVQQNGIDLTLESLAEVRGGFLGINERSIDEYKPLVPDNEGWFAFGSGAYEVIFQQKIKVPEKMCAQIIQRSSLNRIGAFIISGLYDSGFENQIGAILRTDRWIKVQKGARVAQIIFMEAEEASLYNGIYQKK